MPKLPAHGRELLTARMAGYAPAPLFKGGPGFALVTDSWEIANLQRELGRCAMVIEPGVHYDWCGVKGLDVWIVASVPLPMVEVAARQAGARDVVMLCGGVVYNKLLAHARAYLQAA